MFRSPPQLMWDLTIYLPSVLWVLVALVPFPNPPPFGAQHPCWHIASCQPPVWGLASLLAHRPVSGSDTICNGPNSPLADIVLFGSSLSGFPSRFLKHVCKGEVFTPLWRMFRSPPQPMWEVAPIDDRKKPLEIWPVG